MKPILNDQALADRGLDKIDLRILRVLQADGRISNTELAQRVGLSQSACLRRVQRLEQAGVIEGYGALLSPAKLGKPETVFIEITLRDLDATVRFFQNDVVAAFPGVKETALHAQLQASAESTAVPADGAPHFVADVPTSAASGEFLNYTVGLVDAAGHPLTATITVETDAGLRPVELLASGEVIWSGRGSISVGASGTTDGWVVGDYARIVRLNSALTSFEGADFREFWQKHLPAQPAFQANPQLALPLLGALKDDPSSYVRRSVANHLGDIAKDLGALPPELATEGAALKRAVDDVGAIFMGMMGKLGQSPYHVGLHGNRILFALAEVIIGWRLLVNAKVALAAQAGAAERDRPFYAGKVAAARFFAREVLPAITASRKIIEGGDLGLMELSDDAW